jgi:hypothetical protein
MSDTNSSLSSAYLTELTNSKDNLDYVTSRNEYTEFFRFRRPVLDPVVTGYNYIFMTSPDLNLSNEQNKAALNISGTSIYPSKIIDMLSGNQGIFIPLITNRAISIPASDEVLATVDYSETWNKYKIVLGTTSKDSKISGTCTINFQDDQYLTLLKLHKLWKEYIEKVYLGRAYSKYAFQSGSIGALSQYIDYMSSIYVFTTLPDGKTLTFWSKYTGVFPTKLPFGDFQSDDGSQDVKKSFSYEYQFSYKEDMSVQILQDFNLLANSANSQIINTPTSTNNLNNYEVNLTPGDNMSVPYIEFNKGNFDNIGQASLLYNNSNTFSLVFPREN